MDSNKIPGVTYVFGQVTKLDLGKVILRSGEALCFDFCVLAVGFSSPLIKPKVGQTYGERSDEVNRYCTAITQAKSVAVLGGGVVGVELAGDVRDVVAADCVVTLVCRGGVLQSAPEKYQKKTEAKLKERNITVLIDALADELKDGSTEKATYKLQSGASLTADVVIPAYSRGFQTEFLQDVDGLLDHKGAIIVNEFMQSPKNMKVFAVGCSNLKEFTAIPKIEGQAKTASTNILKLIAGKSPASLLKHSENLPFMKSPPVQKIGHDSFAWMDTGNLPPPVACCARIGFPFCPPPCCWGCVCHPCCCAGPCQDPEGKPLASFLKGMLHKSAGSQGFKGFGEAPAQQTMGV
jgi:NADH dehydrogenase FAD-containing subunit